jgi:hypothetical protein
MRNRGRRFRAAQGFDDGNGEPRGGRIPTDVESARPCRQQPRPFGNSACAASLRRCPPCPLNWTTVGASRRRSRSGSSGSAAQRSRVRSDLAIGCDRARPGSLGLHGRAQARQSHQDWQPRKDRVFHHTRRNTPSQLRSHQPDSPRAPLPASPRSQATHKHEDGVARTCECGLWAGSEREFVAQLRLKASYRICLGLELARRLQPGIQSTSGRTSPKLVPDLPPPDKPDRRHSPTRENQPRCERPGALNRPRRRPSARAARRAPRAVACSAMRLALP